MSILVLGNGSSVMDYEFGSLIDSQFDQVIRFNRFKTKGYEKHVGTKIDIWTVADVGLDNWVLNTEEGIEGSESGEKENYQGIVVYCPKFKFHEVAHTFDQKIENSDFKNKQIIKLLSPEIENQIEQVVNFAPAWPTAGLIMLTAYSSLYPGQVYCHGFDICSPKYEFIEYFESRKERKTSWARRSGRTDHHLDAEQEYFDYLINTDKVKNLKDHAIIKESK